MLVSLNNGRQQVSNTGNEMSKTAQTRAEKSAEAMVAKDRFTEWLKMDVEEVTEGSARVSMRVENHHLNSKSICHGGIIFALADNAFAYACNSYNQLALAQQASINFLLPSHAGEKLIAVAREVDRRGRSGIYDVDVSREDGEIVARFRGNSRTIKGSHFDE